VNVIQKNATVSTVESENPNGEFEVILSTETKDRDNENLWASEWKTPLPAKIHIDGDHGRSLDKTVGSAVPRLEGNRMVAKGTFASTPYAQMVRQLVNEGHINSLSVTYSESKSEKGEGVQRELLNAAFVAVPANPEAVVLASKNAKLDKAEGGLSASGDNPQVPKHDDMIQAIHDAACHLGAQCSNEIEADPGTSDGANKGIPGPTGTVVDGLITIDKSSSPEGVGSPQESAEESAEPAAQAAGSAEESADDTAHQKAKELERARGLAFLISMNAKD
jgi:hypothetical protein